MMRTLTHPLSPDQGPNPIPATPFGVHASGNPIACPAGNTEGFGDHVSPTDKGCMWAFGNNLPGATTDFGRNAQYGPVLCSSYLIFGGRGAAHSLFNNFRQIIPNPCRRERISSNNGHAGAGAVPPLRVFDVNGAGDCVSEPMRIPLERPALGKDQPFVGVDREVVPQHIANLAEVDPVAELASLTQVAGQALSSRGWTSSATTSVSGRATARRPLAVCQ